MDLLDFGLSLHGGFTWIRWHSALRTGLGLAKPIAVAKGLRLDGVRVLLVEDDEDTREVLTLGLELQGAQVQAVGSARAALLAVEGFFPHATLRATDARGH